MTQWRVASISYCSSAHISNEDSTSRTHLPSVLFLSRGQPLHCVVHVEGEHIVSQDIVPVHKPQHKQSPLERAMSEYVRVDESVADVSSIPATYSQHLAFGTAYICWDECLRLELVPLICAQDRSASSHSDKKANKAP